MDNLDYLKPSQQRRQKRRDKRMGEEVIECYRHGSRSKNCKGYNKLFHRDDFEQAHQKESMKFMHGGGTRFFNDNLQPLIRYLRTNTGKNWNKVHARLCAKLDKNTVSGLHVFNHLFDFVYENTIMDGKQVVHIKFGRRELLCSHPLWPKFYVHHKTGQLMEAPRRIRPPENKPNQQVISPQGAKQ